MKIVNYMKYKSYEQQQKNTISRKLDFSYSGKKLTDLVLINLKRILYVYNIIIIFLINFNFNVKFENTLFSSGNVDVYL